jgi:nicotinate-nucleotide pyrophosphorylase (carboxylating)
MSGQGIPYMPNLPSLSLDIGPAVSRALEEDLGDGDITAALIPTNVSAVGSVICREEAVLCGTAWFIEVFRQLDSSITIHWQAEDGDDIEANQTLCTLEGPARSLLTGERAALNFLQTLSATATAARRYVRAIAGTSATVLDTRKTLPGLRTPQKYAVACGGGQNHRMGLYDAFLIKENHILACGGIAPAVEHARSSAPGKPVEVEVETLDELQQALTAGADTVMLDNMDLNTMRRAVEINREQTQGRTKLEASGGITLETIRTIAETGVDYISVGSITKDIQAIDLSMRLTHEEH